MASTKGHCISCANCPWMELNTLEKLIAALNCPKSHELSVDENIRLGALKPLERTLIPTGLYFELPGDYEIQVRPRSGLALKRGLTVLNTPGTVDSFSGSH